MRRKMASKGVLAFLGLLGIYFLFVSLVSGFAFALIQFNRYWYFILGLAGGFGIQVALYSLLKEKVSENADKGVITVSGTTSSLAMVSCCSHYLVNLLPILGIGGILTLVSQFQIQFFWVGLTANFLGILFLVSRLRKVKSNENL